MMTRNRIVTVRRSCWHAIVGAFLTALGLPGQAEAGYFDWYTNPINGHEYRLTSDRMSWTDAQNEALGVGGYLATLTSAEEEAWFVSVFTTGGIGDLTHANIWIGLTDINSSPGNWGWVTGESLSYTNWRSGNPDNIGVERYVLYFQGAWDNRTNWDQQGPDVNGPIRPKFGVIERNSLAPEPTSLTLMVLGCLGMAGMTVRRRYPRS